MHQKTKSSTPRVKNLLYNDCLLKFQARHESALYTRIGPREFVPFDKDEEMTIGNIKSACERYFIPKIRKNLECDVLAGEQEPSCKTVGQTSDLSKVVYIWFIPSADADESTRKRIGTPSSMATYQSTNFLPPSSKVRSSPSKLLLLKAGKPMGLSSGYPRSLSISDLIRLGKIKNETATTIVQIII